MHRNWLCFVLRPHTDHYKCNSRDKEQPSIHEFLYVKVPSLHQQRFFRQFVHPFVDAYSFVWALISCQFGA